jgi:AcrR family transcriptional regulator
LTTLDANGLADTTVANSPTTHTQNPAAQPFLSREQILTVTTRCLRQQGYDSTTIRAIASMLNCAVGSIYRYFKDKHDLLSAVTQQALAPVEKLAAEGVPMDEAVRQYCRAVAAAPESYRLMFWLACQQKGADVALQAELPGVVQRIIAGWSTQLGSADAAQRVWAHLHAYILLGWGEEQCVQGVLAPLGIKVEAPNIAALNVVGPVAPTQPTATIMIKPAADATAALLDTTPHAADNFDSQAVVSDGDDVTLL